MIEKQKEIDNQPEFYIYDDSLFIKRIPLTNHYYILVDGEWERSASMSARFEDPDYDFKRISEEDIPNTMKIEKLK